jgi:hypothetical protein
MKRSMFFAGALTAGLLTRSRASGAPASQSKSAIPSGFAIGAEDVYAVLESHTVWVPDGNEPRRPIYILSAPWCEPCRELFEGSRSLAAVAQLRWIEIDMQTDRDYKHLSTLYANPGDASIRSVYDKNVTATPLPSDDPAWSLYRWNQNIIDYIWPGLHKMGIQGFPAIVYRDRNGKVRRGDQDLQLVDVGIDEQPLAAPAVTIAEIRALERHKAGASSVAIVPDEGVAELRLSPSALLKPVTKLEGGKQYPAYGFVRVDDIDWIALNVGAGRAWSGITVPRILFGNARDFLIS